MRLLDHVWEWKKTGEREPAEVGVGGNGGGIVVRGGKGPNGWEALDDL